MDNEHYYIIKQIAQKMTDDMIAALCGSGAFQSPRPTALRLTSFGTIEVVELRDDGSIIEPPKRCPKCGPVIMCAKHMTIIT